MAQDYNIWALLIAVLANQLVGALWYSKALFATAWMKEVGHTPETIRENPSKQPFVIAILTSIVLAVALAWANAAAETRGLGGGIVVGLIVAIGLTALWLSPLIAFVVHVLGRHPRHLPEPFLHTRCANHPC